MAGWGDAFDAVSEIASSLLGSSLGGSGANVEVATNANSSNDVEVNPTVNVINDIDMSPLEGVLARSQDLQVVSMDRLSGEVDSLKDTITMIFAAGLLVFVIKRKFS